MVRLHCPPPSPLLIVQTGRAPPELRARLGDFPHWFRCALGIPRDLVRLVYVDAGEPLPDARNHSAILVTGSAAMVTERAAWSERTGAWLRDVVERDLCPVFGVCFGHQLLAMALGGTVDWNPRGREIGTAMIRCMPAARRDPLFGSFVPHLRAHVTHLQSVLVPPPGAQILAESDLDDCQALRLGERAWSVQFHPEFSTAAIRGYLRLRAADLRVEGLGLTAIERATGPTPHARRLLRRFLALTAEYR